MFALFRKHCRNGCIITENLADMLHTITRKEKEDRSRSFKTFVCAAPVQVGIRNSPTADNSEKNMTGRGGSDQLSKSI